MLKRAFDVCFASCALLTLVPLLLALGLWVKIDSRGPLLFRQIRVGLNGRQFRILKLRTMRTDVVSDGRLEPQITVEADPRITRAGTFLRKYKLDELPQFFNVLIGDMSVVGPRPEVPHYVAKYAPELRKLVLSVRPGITDSASIAFRDEGVILAASADPERTYVETILPTKLRYAQHYAQEQSFWMDLSIICKTIYAVFHR